MRGGIDLGRSALQEAHFQGSSWSLWLDIVSVIKTHSQFSITTKGSQTQSASLILLHQCGSACSVGEASESPSLIIRNRAVSLPMLRPCCPHLYALTQLFPQKKKRFFSMAQSSPQTQRILYCNVNTFHGNLYEYFEVYYVYFLYSS